MQARLKEQDTDLNRIPEPGLEAAAKPSVLAEANAGHGLGTACGLTSTAYTRSC
jgi:hypothetical protein